MCSVDHTGFKVQVPIEEQQALLKFMKFTAIITFQTIDLDSASGCSGGQYNENL